MNDRPVPQAATPETSVVIRAFNEQKHLPALFDALARQAYRNFETIVVDSGSFDDTRAIAATRADRLLRISSHDFTFGYSLNAGIRAACGRYIVMASAHTVPCDEHWLGQLVAPLADSNVAMTYGRQLGVESSKFCEVKDMERAFGPNPRDEHPSRFAVNNANSAVRRDLWLEHPFDEALPGLEDVEWARHWIRKGFAVRYVPEAALYHIHEETWPQIRRRFYREAVAWRRMSIRGRRHIPMELIREAGRAAADCARALTADANPAARRLSRPARLAEILAYRLHKNAGVMRGFFESHPLETRASYEAVLFNRAVKAVVIKGPGQAALESVDLPELKPGDVLIHVAHVAICATDHEIRNGTLGYYANGMAQYPIVPGHEFSGRVSAVGRNVTGFREHDPVVVECIQGCGTCAECRADNAIGCAERKELGVMGLNGAYAEYVIAPSRFVHRVPDGMDLRRAALAEPTAVVLKALRRLSAVAGADGGARKPVGVAGAGPLGHLCAKILKHRGHDVTAYDRDDRRLAFFAGTGIKTTASPDDIARFPLIVEITGDPQSLDSILHKSPANAAILLLGLPYGKQPFSFETIAAFDKTVIGSVGSTAADFEAAIRLLPEIDLDPYFRCALPLEDFGAAWDKSKSGEVLKVLLNVAGR